MHWNVYHISDRIIASECHKIPTYLRLTIAPVSAACASYKTENVLQAEHQP